MKDWIGSAVAILGSSARFGGYSRGLAAGGQIHKEETIWRAPPWDRHPAPSSAIPHYNTSI